jgi:4-hydroxybenzoate polyprenyltransferase
MNRAKLADYVELVRLPGAVTAVADVLGGALLASGRFEPAWLVLCLASALLYSGGVALNDVCDHERDQRRWPQRPLPSGRIGRDDALVLSTALLGGGVLLALLVRPLLGLVAAALCGCIVLYDLGLKRRWIGGALAMGGCRALNLLLGVVLAGGSALEPGLLRYALIHLGYVAAMLVVSRLEFPGGGRVRLLAALLAVGACTNLLLRTLPPDAWGAQLWVAIFVLAVGGPLVQAVRSSTPARLQLAAQAVALSVILLDAVYAAAGSGPTAGLGVALLLVPAVWLWRLAARP